MLYADSICGCFASVWKVSHSTTGAKCTYSLFATTFSHFSDGPCFYSIFVLETRPASAVTDVWPLHCFDFQQWNIPKLAHLISDLRDLNDFNNICNSQWYIHSCNHSCHGVVAHKTFMCNEFSKVYEKATLENVPVWLLRAREIISNTFFSFVGYRFLRRRFSRTVTAWLKLDSDIMKVGPFLNLLSFYMLYNVIYIKCLVLLCSMFFSFSFTFSDLSSRNLKRRWCCWVFLCEKLSWYGTNTFLIPIRSYIFSVWHTCLVYLGLSILNVNFAMWKNQGTYHFMLSFLFMAFSELPFLACLNNFAPLWFS